MLGLGLGLGRRFRFLDLDFGFRIRRLYLRLRLRFGVDSRRRFDFRLGFRLDLGLNLGLRLHFRLRLRFRLHLRLGRFLRRRSGRFLLLGRWSRVDNLGGYFHKAHLDGIRQLDLRRRDGRRHDDRGYPKMQANDTRNGNGLEPCKTRTGRGMKTRHESGKKKRFVSLNAVRQLEWRSG
jgi:hypothetical protein